LAQALKGQQNYFQETIIAGAGAVKNTSAATWRKISSRIAGKLPRAGAIREASLFPLEAGKSSPKSNVQRPKKTVVIK